MSCFLSILVLLFFIFPSLRTCSYSLSLVNLAQSSFFMLVFSTFWTPQYVPASSYPFPLCLSKSLFPALCSMPVLFCFFFPCFPSPPSHLSLPVFLLLLFFIYLDTCRTKSPNPSRDWSQPPATQRGGSPRNRASPRHSRVYGNRVACGSLNVHQMCSVFISVTGSTPPTGEMAATGLWLRT